MNSARAQNRWPPSWTDGGAEEERDHILGHLAVCNRCREIHILAHNLSKTEPVQHWRRGWYMAGGALALAALVVLAVKLTIQQPVSPGQRVAQAPTIQPQLVQVPPGATTPAEPKAPETPVQTVQPQRSLFPVGMGKETSRKA